MDEIFIFDIDRLSPIFNAAYGNKMGFGVGGGFSGSIVTGLPAMVYHNCTQPQAHLMRRFGFHGKEHLHGRGVPRNSVVIDRLVTVLRDMGVLTGENARARIASSIFCPTV